MCGVFNSSPHAHCMCVLSYDIIQHVNVLQSVVRCCACVLRCPSVTPTLTDRAHRRRRSPPSFAAPSLPATAWERTRRLPFPPLASSATTPRRNSQRAAAGSGTGGKTAPLGSAPRARAPPHVRHRKTLRRTKTNAVVRVLLGPRVRRVAVVDIEERANRSIAGRPLPGARLETCSIEGLAREGVERRQSRGAQIPAPSRSVSDS